MISRELRRHVAAIGRESWLLFFAISAANASNYVFHVVISRMLAPSDYGALGAVLAILVFLSVPLGAVQTTIAKRVAQRAHSGGWVLILRTVGPVALILSVVLVALSPLLRLFLRLEGLTALFAALYVLPALASTALRGVLQGEMRFKALAVASAAPMFLRLAVGIPLVSAGSGVSGAVAASVVAETLGFVIVLAMVRVRGKVDGAAPDLKLMREVLPIAAGFAAMWLLVELDLVLARHYLPPGEAGDYAAAGLLARAVLFVPGAVSLVALPHFSRVRGRGTDAHRWLMSSSIIVIGLGVAVALVLSLGAPLIVRLTFGSGFEDGAALLPTMALAMVGMGLANLLVYFHIAAGSRMFHLLWPLAIVELVTIALIHGSGESIALIVCGTGWVAAAFGFVAARSVATAQSTLSRILDDISLHTTRSEGSEAPELSLVIPSHNGGERLPHTVREMVEVLDDTKRSYEVIVVSDGSTDGCEHAVVEAAGSVDVLHYTQRRGKGVALRVGMTRARGRYVAFIDGDGDLNPRELKGFLALMELYEPDLVIGSKRHPLSTVTYPATRRVMSWMYQRLVRVLFGLNIRDTQTGMKLIRRDVLDAVLPRMLEKRFAFDLEFLVVAKRAGYTRFFEAPIRLDQRFGSTVSPRAVARILLDTAAIFYRRYFLRFYDFTPVERASEAPGFEAEVSTLVEHAAGP